MNSRLAALMCFFALVTSSDAGPPEGRYTGVLRVTKWVDGLEVTTTVKAVAKVGAEGALTIVLATAPSPIPVSEELGGTASGVLYAKINTDGTCLLPLPTSLPPPDGIWAVMPIPIIVPPKEQFRGIVSSKGNVFTLSYHNIPISTFSARNLIRFDYTFRLKSR